jgi:hypothetical protein
MHLSQACISYRRASLTGVRLSQAYISRGVCLTQAGICHRHESVTGMNLSQVCICHRYASVTGMHLSQACISYRRASLTAIHLSQACICHRRASLIDIHLFPPDLAALQYNQLTYQVIRKWLKTGLELRPKSARDLPLRR